MVTVVAVDEAGAVTLMPRSTVPPRPVKNYQRIAPAYSDYAIEHDTWARAWLLLDISERGDVTRVKLLTTGPPDGGFELSCRPDFQGVPANDFMLLSLSNVMMKRAGHCA